MSEQPPVVGYVVLLRAPALGEDRYTIDWDGDLHTDRARAEQEAAEAVASGYPGAIVGTVTR